MHQLADFFEHLLQGVRAYMLGDLLKLPGDTFTSIYDLVDDWKHIVKLRTFCQIETITLMAITHGCSSEP